MPTAHSAVTQIATRTIVLEGDDKAIRIAGKLAGSYYAGQAVYQTAVDTWTATTGTASVGRNICGWVDHKMRTSSTFGEVDLDTQITDGTAQTYEIVVGPRDGSVKIAALCLNLSAAKYYGHDLYATSGGKLDNHDEQLSARVQAIITEEGYAAGGTVVEVYIV